MRRFLPANPASRQMMVAVVLGALATTSANRATAAATGGAPSAKAVTDISKYCQTCWRNARLPTDRWQDCTQEVFVRLLERVEGDKWGQLLVDDESLERREFIRAIDAVKKRTQRARKFTNLTPDVPERRPISNSLKDDRDAVAKASAALLSPRQRKLLDLTADGWTVPEIASELSTTPERISDEKYKAVKKLQHYFQA